MRGRPATGTFFALCFIALLWIPVVSASAAGQAEVKGIRHWSSQGSTRIVIELSRPVEYEKNRLSGPDRLYFDLKDARIPREVRNRLPVGDGILKAIRAGQYDGRTVRIVLDLERMEDFNAFTMEDPPKIVIDVSAKRPEAAVLSRKVVVVDAGHGGHDPGAVGPGGLQEKEVTLDIALKVREILGREPDIGVILTRDTDIFIPLVERTAIARKHDADLFVSVHANASPNRRARGIETYLLNWTNDDEAIRVAARENAVSMKRMREIMAQYKTDDYVGRMLSDLNRDFKRDESLALANYVQDALYGDIARINRRSVNLGVKQALFYVLVGASMPSVLAEVSFISNPEEERLLARESYRSLIARSIADGIRNYLSSSAPAQKVVYSRQRP